jgi:hypothetical protein
MRQWTATTLVLSLLILSTSCSYHRAHFDYTDEAGAMSVSATAQDGERLGLVSANEGGAIWNDCTGSARGTLWLLMDRTKKLGGNAIGEIRWIPKSGVRSTGEPTCKKQWAWFLVWPVLLTPVFMSSRAEAYAYKIPEGAESVAGLYRIPDSEAGRRQLADRILAENPPFARR